MDSTTLRFDAFRLLRDNLFPSVLLGGATLFAIMSWLRPKAPKPIKRPVDLNNQSKILEGEERIHVHANYDATVSTNTPGDVKTLYEVFLRGLRLSDNGECLGWRDKDGGPYKWMKYQEVHDKAQYFGSGLFCHGVKPGTSTFIGIYAQNRPEWFLAQLACTMYSMVVIPLYDTLGPQAIIFTINQAEIETIVVDNQEKIEKLLDQKDNLPSMKRIICMDRFDDDLVQSAAEKGVSIFKFQEILGVGANDLKDPIPPSATDISIISYTSGSTGDPKGVMTTHVSMMLFMNSIVYQLTACEFFLDTSDVVISYLPMAHLYEQMSQCIVINHGSRIGFFRGDIKLLLSDISELKPTFFPAVPRVLNKIYDQVTDKVSRSKIKSTLLNMALASKQKDVNRGIYRKDTIWDKLMLGKIQNLLGGRVRLISSASAPLRPVVMQFCRCALGCVLIEGYGQTENVSVTFQFPCETGAGHVGPPVIDMQIKLIDVPEMNYYAAEDQGEVCFKSPIPLLGYYKNPEKTAEVLDSNGWILSGDIGEWLPNGCLKIIDRRKNIFKLCQGEYIAPEKIELVYVGSKYVMQVFVDGNSLENCIVAFVVPDPIPSAEWAKNNGVDTDIEKLCSHKAFKKVVFDDMQAVGKKAALKSFEQMKALHMQSTQFSVENGLLTPTFKNKRTPLRKHFTTQMTEMYATLNK
ncbi:long-chain-fatty-acid--CoA ligase 5-like [Lineus longissimus]|uniref:long-chain-fatty-acid--CoA ligase 5-like n=1 Tax=Lineus longissimus TaxID=88925 RepID=UPI002B4E53AE